jgi:hypothetical protein
LEVTDTDKHSSLPIDTDREMFHGSALLFAFDLTCKTYQDKKLKFLNLNKIRKRMIEKRIKFSNQA